MFEVEVVEFDICEEHEERVRYDKKLDDKYWNMRKRCLDKNNKDYENYGGRGITIYEDWLNDKYLFFKYCYTVDYRQDLEIDRIDNNGNYEPGNIRFVTRTENRNNRRDSK